MTADTICGAWRALAVRSLPDFQRETVHIAHPRRTANPECSPIAGCIAVAQLTTVIKIFKELDMQSLWLQWSFRLPSLTSPELSSRSQRLQGEESAGGELFHLVIGGPSRSESESESSGGACTLARFEKTSFAAPCT